MTVRYALLVLALVLCAVPAVQAQETFTVTVQTKTASHPYSGMGHPAGYVIDGVEASELTLVRGLTYVFQMDGVESFHPFYLSTSDAGGGAGVFSEGVTGNGVSGDGTLTFAVPMTAPDLLWYQCQNHQFMGWRLSITNGVSNEDEAQPIALSLGAAYPNPFAGRTRLGLDLDRAQDVVVAVFDVAGRRVATLHEGTLPGGQTHTFTFDARALDLADGAYVVRATAGAAVAERRVTLVR